MGLRETLEKWPHDRLVKELHATAKRNAVLEDEAQRLRHEVFWLRAEIQTDRDNRLVRHLIGVG